MNGTRKTFDQFLFELRNIYGDQFEPLDNEYLNCKTKKKFKCKCGKIIERTPDVLLNAKNYAHCECQEKIYSHDDHIKRLNKKFNGRYEPIDTYVDQNTKIQYKDISCGHIYKKTPRKMMSIPNCPICGKLNMADKQRFTTNEIANKIQENYNGRFELIGEYKKQTTKVKIKCNDCGNVFDAYPHNFYRGIGGCAFCVGYVVSVDEIKQRIKDTIGSEYEFISKNDKNTKGIEIRHIPCGTIFKTTYNQIKYQLHPCPKCNRGEIEKSRRDNERKKIVEKFKTIPEFAIVDINDYKNNFSKIRFLHNVCGREFRTTVNNLLMYECCFYCDSSKGEKQINQFLTDNKIKFESQKTFDDCRGDKKLLRFDFYLPDYNFCIEFDGLQHFEPMQYSNGKERFLITQKHDKIKTEYCEQNNIGLLRIRYDEKDLIRFLGDFVKEL